MRRFVCPYLGAEVDLSDERQRHIAERHPDFLPAYEDRLATTLLDPDQVRRSSRFAAARLFSRWHNDVNDGKNIVVVVVSEAENGRHWVITAYMTGRLAPGDIEWQRS